MIHFVDSAREYLLFYERFPILLNESPKIQVIIGKAPVVYAFEIDEKNVSKSFATIRSFVTTNNSEIAKLEALILKSAQKDDTTVSNESVLLRLPPWFSKNKLKVQDAISLILYIADKPLSVSEITLIMNTSYNKIHLKNVSKYLTSKTTYLYGYTSYDNKTRKYSLSNFGRIQIQMELSDKIPNQFHIKKISGDIEEEKDIDQTEDAADLIQATDNA